MKTLYQKLVDSYIVWIIAGFFFVGSLLDTVSNTLDLITPMVTWIGTVGIILIFISSNIYLRKRPIIWISEDNQQFNIHSLGLKPALMLFGVLLSLWVPNLINSNSVTTDFKEIERVIYTEVEASIAKDLLLLESLFSENAIVIDRQGTPLDSSDDLVYEGWEQIKEQHYIRFFACCNWESMSIVDLDIEASEYEAVGVHQGIIIDNEYYSEDITIYTLEKIQGKWLIVQLEFDNK